jgi:hypothetical protein
MQNKPEKRLQNKGMYLELRVARLLLAEGFSPFVNVFFRSALDPHSVVTPDIDVMGCYVLSDATIVYVHYDCKSGASDVIGRILMLAGLRNKIPSGPIVYIRPTANLELRKYAAQYNVRLTDIGQLEQLEAECVVPLFGQEFPSISDRSVHETWLSVKSKTKDRQLGRILKYFDFSFWSEEPFTRIRRTLSALERLEMTYADAGINRFDGNILTSCVLRRLVFALIAGASNIVLLSEEHVRQTVEEKLVTENISASDLHNIVESAVQLTFQIYGDPSKGPLRTADYRVTAPDYAEELSGLILRLAKLYGSLSAVLPVFDSLVMESAVLKRKDLAEALLRNLQPSQIRDAIRWLRSLRLFVSTIQPSLKDWDGWSLIYNNSHTMPSKDTPHEQSGGIVKPPIGADTNMRLYTPGLEVEQSPEQSKPSLVDRSTSEETTNVAEAAVEPKPSVVDVMTPRSPPDPFVDLRSEDSNLALETN